MAIKEKVFFCPNTLRIVGFAEDAFDLNIIKKELEQRINSTANNTNDKEKKSSNQSGKSNSPPLVKHFLAYIFTS